MTVHFASIASFQPKARGKTPVVAMTMEVTTMTNGDHDVAIANADMRNASDKIVNTSVLIVVNRLNTCLASR